MSKIRKPAYTLHNTSGQARVRIRGVSHYLGKHGTPESWARYDELIEDLLRQESSACFRQLTVGALAVRYQKHAATYYTKNGEPTSEAHNVAIALRHLIKLYRRELARDFGPKKLKGVRDAMIAAGCVRTSINRMVGRIRRMFRWAVEEELIPGDVYGRLAAVAGLRKGRSAAVESSPVKPVPEEWVNAIEPFVSRQVWAMVQLQSLTGARPGEIVAMRGCDLNTQGKVWEYVPESHKAEHHGRSRTVFLGPRAQTIVREFLKPDTQAFLFSPADARAEYQAKRRAARKTPVQPSQQDRRKAAPKKRPGACYTVVSYRAAIVKACDKAGVPHWHPHQLRHSAATTIRREAGLDTARTVLGHASLKVTEVYAERDAAAARQIMGQIG